MNALSTESAKNASMASYGADSVSDRTLAGSLLSAGARAFTDTLNEMIRMAGERTAFSSAAFRNGHDMRLSRNLRTPHSPVSGKNKSSSAFEREEYGDIQTASAGSVYQNTEPRRPKPGTATETDDTLSGGRAGNSGAKKTARLTSSETQSGQTRTNGAPIVSGQSLITDEGALDPALGGVQKADAAIGLNLLQQVAVSNATLIPGGTALSQGVLALDGFQGVANNAGTIMQGPPVGGGFTHSLSGMPAQAGVVQGIGLAYEDLADQLIQGVRIAQSSKSTEVLVRLKPDFLGRLTIRVLADEHGMRLEIRAENEAVRQVMQDNLADLEQRLAEKGLELSQFNILADTGRRSHQEEEWSFRPSHSPHGTETEDSFEREGMQLTLTKRGIIDYLA